MTGGHVPREKRRTDTFEGHTIQSMLADFQNPDVPAHGGNGYMRIWEFSPANQTVTVRTYSPELDKWDTDADSEFTLDVDLRGSGGSFRQVVVADAAPEQIETTLADLEPGKTYEWYADVASCGKSSSTPLYRFTTGGASARQRGPAAAAPRRDRSRRIPSGAFGGDGVNDPSLTD
jgi:hypothetical protein